MINQQFTPGLQIKCQRCLVQEVIWRRKNPACAWWRTEYPGGVTTSSLSTQISVNHDRFKLPFLINSWREAVLFIIDLTLHNIKFKEDREDDLHTIFPWDGKEIPLPWLPPPSYMVGGKLCIFQQLTLVSSPESNQLCSRFVVQQKKPHSQPKSQ